MGQPTTFTWIVETPSSGGGGGGGSGGGVPIVPLQPPPPIINELTSGGCVDIQQSAISEMRDQLFLDSADGVRLNIVTSNLGMDRPVFGFDDDHWRFAGKQLLLQSKNVKTSFQRCLEVCLGPQKIRIGDLSIVAAAGDRSVFITDPITFLQVGRLIFDPGLSTEESVGYCFVDYTTNEVLLSNTLKFNHAVKTHVSSFLATSVNAGVTTITLTSTTGFPIVYPYSIIIDKGLVTEELLVVTNNNTATNVLTLSVVTKQPHNAATAKFTKRNVSSAQPAKVAYIKITDTRNFPSSGSVRINKGGGTQEIIKFTDNNASDNYLITKTLTKFSHSAGESVELIEPGAIVETCSVIEKGIYWDIFETQPRRVKVFVPNDIISLRSIDGSWFHKAVPGAFSTTLAANALATDTSLQLTSVSGLPDEAGILLINGTLTVFYDLRNELTTPHPVVFLSQAIGTAFSSGTAVALQRFPYGGTDLEDGNPRDSSGAVQPNRFPGPYIYDVNQFAFSAISSSLTSALPAPVEIASTQLSGFTNIEVFDASSWPAPPTGYPIQCKISYATGNEEIIDCIDRTLKKDCSATIGTGTSIGATTLLYANTGASEFPESDGIHPAGYRVIINKGTGTEETATVLINNVGSHQFTFAIGLTFAHSTSEPVVLIRDVLTFDVLQSNHIGPTIHPSVGGEFIFPLISQISVTSGTNFPNTGDVYFNFGSEIPNTRSKIASKTSNTVWILNSTAAFPTTNYPYFVKLGEGSLIQEIVSVTNNNTGTNTLTLASPGAVNSHVPGTSYVDFTSGFPEVVAYTGKSGNNLLISPPIVTASKHIVGERVMYTPGASFPNQNGFDYALKFPPRFDNCLTLLFDLVRAAGIKVDIIRER